MGLPGSVIKKRMIITAVLGVAMTVLVAGGAFIQVAKVQVADTPATDAQATTALTAEQASSPVTESSTFQTIEWTDLMPEEDLQAILAMPSFDHDETAPSLEDQITRQIEQAVDMERNQRYLEALKSARVRPELNATQVRIPGFIVPLEFDDNQVVTEFFLVPYFGACIHVPPPPPNQIIYVKASKGIQLDDLYTPFWISGTLRTQDITNELAHAAYSLTAMKIEIYDE